MDVTDLPVWQYCVAGALLFLIITGIVLAVWKVRSSGRGGATWEDIAAIDAIEMGAPRPHDENAQAGRADPECAPPLPLAENTI